MPTDYELDPYRSLPTVGDDFTPMWRVYIFTPGQFQRFEDEESIPTGARDRETGGRIYTILTETKQANVVPASWGYAITSIESSLSTTQHRHSEATITLEAEDGQILDDPNLVEGLFVRIDMGYSNTNAGPNFGPVFFGKISRVEPEFSKGVTVSVVCQPVEADYTNHQIRYDMPVGVTSGTVAKYIADYMGMAISMPLETPEAPAGYNFGIGSPIYLLYRLSSAVGFRFWIDNYVIYFVDELNAPEDPTTAIFSYKGHERNVWSAQITYDPMAANSLHQFGNIDSETGEVILETSGADADPDLSAEQPSSEAAIQGDRNSLLSLEPVYLGDAQRAAPDLRSTINVVPPQFQKYFDKVDASKYIERVPPRGFVDIELTENGISWSKKPAVDQTPKHLWKVLVEMENMPQTAKEAKKLADAVSGVKKFPHILMMEAVGAWTVRPGDKVFVRGLCQRFDGDWLVDEITHKCSGRSFRSMIKARRNLLYTPKRSALPRSMPERSWEDIQREASLSYSRNMAQRKRQETMEIVKGRVANMDKFLAEQGARLDLSQLPEASFQGAETLRHNAFVDELHKRLGLKSEVMPEGYTLYRPAVGSNVYVPGVSVTPGRESWVRRGHRMGPTNVPGSVPFTDAESGELVRQLNELEDVRGYIPADHLHVRKDHYVWAPSAVDPAEPNRVTTHEGFVIVCFNQPLDRIGATRVSGAQSSYWLIHERDMPEFRRLVKDMHRDSLELVRWEAELEEQS